MHGENPKLVEINLNTICDSRYSSVSAVFGKQDGGRMKIFFCFWFVGNN